MLMSNDFLPGTDDGLIRWFNNFQLKLGGFAPALGITVPEVDAIRLDYATLFFAMNFASTFRAESKERTKYKDLLRDGPIGATPAPLPTVPTIVIPAALSAPGIVPRLRAMVSRIKAAPAFTDTMGKDLEILKDADEPSDDTAQPSVSASPFPGSEVRVKWVKGNFDGVTVEGQRGNETAWAVLGMDTSSPYLDSRPALVAGAPELRRYRLRYFRSDAPVGAYSSPVIVTTTP